MSKPKTESTLTEMHTDIMIIGGGSVGAMLALSLAKDTDLSITLLEQQAPEQLFNDPRHIALAASTVESLLQLGIEVPTIAYPIKQIHVSDTGFLGQCRLQASEVKKEALGYVISLATLTKTLHAHLSELCQVNVVYATQVTGHRFDEQHQMGQHIVNTAQYTWQAQQCIVAAGSSETNPDMLAAAREQDYGQFGVVANVTSAGNGYSRYLKTTAFERFTASGPLAMLPYADNQYSMLWSLTEEDAQEFLHKSEAEQLHAIQQSFGTRLGRFVALEQPVVFPLKLKQQVAVDPRVVVLGNAAQTLHPIAGQGFNLAHRDVTALVKLCKQSPFSRDLAEKYHALRQSDRDVTIAGTEWLLHSFSHQLMPFVVPRNIGLFTLQKLGVLRRYFSRFAMGYR